VICAVTLLCGGIIYFFGRRSAGRLSDDERLAHLARLDLVGAATPTSPAPAGTTSGAVAPAGGDGAGSAAAPTPKEAP
jgi:hypothetical protein